MRWLVLVVMLWSASPVRADVPDDAEVECRGKDVGDACTDGGCMKTTCSRSRPYGPDNQLRTETWECMRCEAGAPVKTSRLRLGLGIGAALLVIGGGVWLARKKMKAGTAA